MRIDNFLIENNVRQIYISKSISSLKKIFDYISDNIEFKFTYDEYHDENENILFFGLYKEYEVDLCMNHKGNIWVLWYENDCSPLHKFRVETVKKITTNKNIKHLSCNYATSYNLNKLKVDYNVLDIKILFISKKTNFKLIVNEKIFSIAKNLKLLLNNIGYSAEIILDLKLDTEKNNDIYIIIYHKFYSEEKLKLPFKYIFYQIEQKTSRYFKKKYFDIMNKSIAIWDFSLANINYYNSKIEHTKLNYIPFPISNKEVIYKENILYDIFFYGTINPRRESILKYLKKKYKIYYGNNIINEERDTLIKKSKIILNIHYYDKCSLETCRINEILNFNKLILSEYPSKEDHNNLNLYSNCIKFFDIIDSKLRNIGNLTKLIDFYLNEENNINFTKKLPDEKEKIYNFCRDSLEKILI